MKFDTYETNHCCEDKEEEKIYRNCLLLNLKTYELIDGPDDMIVSEDNIPEDTIIVDVGIAEIIRDLNKKGYKTIFSCQGHFDKDIFKDNEGEYHSGISAPYIMFEAGEFLNKYITHIFRIPRQFEVEICDKLLDTAEIEIQANYGHYGIYSSKKRIVIRSKMSYVYEDTDDGLCFDVDKLSVNKFNAFNTMDLIALSKWVGELPDLSKETIEFSNGLYDIRYIDHETAKQCGFDFESVQEYVEDIKESYNIAADSIKEINEHMRVISNMITHIGKRLAAMKVVEDIRDIDDTSMYESCVIEESFPTKDNYKDLARLFERFQGDHREYNKSKFTAPISPEEVKNTGEKYADTTAHIKDLVDKACEEKYKEDFAESLIRSYKSWGDTL